VFVRGVGTKVIAAATDSYRLAEEQVLVAGMPAEWQLLLPLTTAHEIVRLFSAAEQVTITPRASHVVITADSIELTSRLVDGTYPNYQHIIPQAFSATGSVERDELLRALKTLLVFLPRDSRRVAVHVGPRQGMLTIKTGGGNAGAGDVRVPYQGSGPELDLLFNIQYLIEGLQHVPTERVQLKFVGADSPAVLTPVGSASSYTYVVMPIQV